MDIRENLAKIVRENIGIFDNAGCGMYNLDIDISGIYDKREDGTPYNKMGIFQIYPYNTSEFYKSVYVLAYYPYNEKGDCENDCYDDVDVTAIYNRVVREINSLAKKNYPQITISENPLKPFVNAVTLKDKVSIINAWEEDRGAEAEEFIFDLEDMDDRIEFTRLYGTQTTERCRANGRFWFGGNAFYANEEDKKMCRSTKIWEVSDNNIDATLGSILDEVIVTYTNIISQKDNFTNGINGAISTINGLYHEMIDFGAFYENTNKPKNYRWIACSTDGSFEDESNGTFTSIEDAYLNMRDAVLEKMKWNTEFGDMEDYERLSVGYKLHFGTKEITHDSYSGFYIYRIVEDGNEKGNLIYLIKKAYSEGAKTINSSIPILTSTRSKSAVLNVNGFNEVFFDNGKEYPIDDLTTYDLLLLYGDMVCHTEEQHLF